MASANQSRLPRQVFWLGVVSLATDASSDLIYPLLPLFLTTVLGAGSESLGAIEGAAEATAALLKLISGRLADRARRRKPLTLFGYTLSAVARPLAGLATAPWMLFAVRIADRVGKGVRSSPRDALVADVTPPGQRGRAYGFHRAMDNTGAVIGPALATLLLMWGKLSLRSIFLVAAIPGVLALLALVFGVVEPTRHLPVATPGPDGPPPPAPSVAASLAVAGPDDAPGLGGFLAALGLFALGNASDAFLLLRARQLGVAMAFIPALWMLHNGVKALLSTAAGALSDRVGRRRVILVGWVLYGLSYLGFGLARAAWQAWALMALYGVYYALTEGSEKALVADSAGPGHRGRAFGWYYAVVGVAALPASFGFGWMSERFGVRLPFTVAAGLALGAAFLLATAVPEPRRARA